MKIRSKEHVPGRIGSCGCEACRLKRREYAQRWMAKNPEKVRHYQLREDAKRRAATAARGRQKTGPKPHRVTDSEARCRVCKVWLPWSAFYMVKSRGYPQSACKRCANAERIAAWSARCAADPAYKSKQSTAKTARDRARRHKDPEYRAQMTAKAWTRAALKRASAGKGESFAREEIYARDRGICHLCGKRAPRSKWDLDHVIPLSRGGHHVRANVAVAHTHCNRVKHNRITTLF